VAQRLKDAGKSVDAAFESGDGAKLITALDVWRRYHLRAFDLFEARPPVIDVQPAMSAVE